MQTPPPGTAKGVCLGAGQMQPLSAVRFVTPASSRWAWPFLGIPFSAWDGTWTPTISLDVEHEMGPNAMWLCSRSSLLNAVNVLQLDPWKSRDDSLMAHERNDTQRALQLCNLGGVYGGSSSWVFFWGHIGIWEVHGHSWPHFCHQSFFGCWHAMLFEVSSAPIWSWNQNPYRSSTSRNSGQQKHLVHTCWSGELAKAGVL